MTTGKHSVDYTRLDDQALMRLIAHSKEDALSELYDRYSRLVYSIAVNAVSDPSLAEEISQEVFIRIWENADSYRPDQGKVVTWMASITRYRSIDTIRRQNVRPEGNQAAWVEESSLDMPDPINLEGEVERIERRDRVRVAIAQLPKEQKVALAYAYFQGYSHREIAAALDEPVGTIKTRIRLGMQKLRQALSEENGTPI
jgi:RNA polymerase sigma-70 factor (ECF subfamily)